MASTADCSVPSCKLTVPAVRGRKGGEPLAMVTAYDYASARAAEAAGVDLVLVGDTAAMTTLGYDGTEPVSFDEMLMLGRAVRRALLRTLMIGDMPMGTYEVSDGMAARNACRLVKETRCDAIKLERAGGSLSRVRAIAGCGIPVMGHIGLTPQTRTSLGGYRTQGRTGESALKLLRDAVALEHAGCFAVVLEAVPARVADEITRRLTIPTIGIGSGPACNGQVLVFNDLIGYHVDHQPRYLRQFGRVGDEVHRALVAYKDAVHSNAFPTAEHSYEIEESELALFLDGAP